MKEIINTIGSPELIAQTYRDFKDLQLLRYLWEYTAENGYPPSRRQMQKELDYSSTDSVTRSLRRLYKYGAIKITPNTPRGIKLCTLSTLLPVIEIK
jgi:SOS-response transcriptional repressor LexA